MNKKAKIDLRGILLKKLTTVTFILIIILLVINNTASAFCYEEIVECDTRHIVWWDPNSITCHYFSNIYCTDCTTCTLQGPYPGSTWYPDGMPPIQGKDCSEAGCFVGQIIIFGEDLGHPDSPPKSLYSSWDDMMNIECDGDGDEHFPLNSCRTPNDDCNDSDAATNPDSLEKCDGKDNNCDWLVDEVCNGSGNDDKCYGKSNNTDVGSSANLASGNLYHSQTLFQTPNSELLTAFTLSYNSLDTTIGSFGKGWTHSYNTNITDNGDTLVLKEADGRMVYLYESGVDTYSPESSSGRHAVITKNPDASYTLKEKTGIIHNFDSNGRLVSITDRNYNTLTLTYTADDLTLITDSAGRNTALSYDSNHRITSIIDSAGRTTAFTYDSEFLSIAADPLGGTWNYTYDADGRMLTKTDPLGHTTTYSYDSNGRIISSRDPEGNTKTISYDPVNQSATVIEKNGTQWTYVYDSALNVPHEITDPSSQKTAYVYDSNRNLITKIEPDGRITSYTYDAEGNMLSQTDAVGNTTTYTYNTFGQVLTKTDSDGNVTTYTYDASGNLIQEIDTQGNITSHTYGSKGEKLSTTDHKGNTTTYAYDQYGNVASVTNALNQTTAYTYDITGNLLSMTDANGNTVAYEYDLGDRLVRETKPDGGVINYGYDLAGNRTAINDANGKRTIYTYDSLNRLIKTTDPEGNSINYTYNSEGNITSMTVKDSANNVITSETYVYDNYNRLIKTTHADGTYTEQSYDTYGNILTKKDENGNITIFTYDAINRLLSVTEPSGGVTSYAYDSRDNLISVTDVNSNTTAYAYDSLNRLISTTSPDTGTTAYTYDSNGNLTAKTDAEGVTTTYTYDALNRLITIRFPDPAQNITYSYDEPDSSNSTGRLSSMIDPSATTWYNYDRMGRIIKETKQINGIVYRTEYTYDLNGNLLTIIYPGGRVVAYTYNPTNRITSVTETSDEKINTIADNIAYLPFADMTSLTYGNNLQQTISYNQRNRITSITAGSIQNLTYSYDNSGNITTITNNIDVTKNKTYTYNAINRLTTAVGPLGSLNYTYDGVGNRQTETTATGLTNYSYNANKLVSSAGEKIFSFSYDANGNTISENQRQYIYNQNQRLTQVTDTGTVLGEYVYNGNGQRVKKVVNGQSTIFHYNQNGMLIAESTSTGTITNEYVYLNGQPLARINNMISGAAYNSPDPLYPSFRASLSLNVKLSSLSTSWLKYYYTRKRLSLVSTSITGLSEEGNTATITGVGTVNNIPDYTFTATITDDSSDTMGIEIRNQDGMLYYSASSQVVASGNYTIGDNIYYYLNDHLGTPMMMTDESGQVVWEGEFMPFGEKLSISGTVTNNLRFAGQYYDSETGLHYNYFRDYNPKIGRYMTYDPMLRGFNLIESSSCQQSITSFPFKDPKKFNPFVYTDNNPINFIDPRGLACGSGWTDKIVPDYYGSFNFTGPCETHDKCYDTCGESKLVCDALFLNDMMYKCRKLTWYPISQFSCIETATIYYAFVASPIGWYVYKNAQEEACCKNKP